MKVSNNSLAQDVARVSISNVATLTLKGTDFTSANQYQEFPIAFNLPGSEDFLIFQFWRIGNVNVELYVDGVTIFTAPQPVVPSLTWAFPGGNYRGQGIWVRYTDGGNNFSDVYDAAYSSPGIKAAPTSLGFLVLKTGPQPAAQAIFVQQTGCSTVSWQVAENSAWLSTQVSGNTIQVWANQSGLKTGTYNTNLIVSGPDISTITIPVQLIVVDQLFHSNLPLVSR
jgi:hypothetical protein